MAKKRTTPARPAKKQKSGRLTASAGSRSATPRVRGRARARVRMYCQGLGDCFLLSVRGKKGLDKHVLIDCGVITGTPGASEKMAAVANHIAATTGNRLDVLVVTHEHWDHVSGFFQAQEVFERLRVGQVWLAWTENPGDSRAQTLKMERKRELQAVAQAAALMHPLSLEELNAVDAEEENPGIAPAGAGPSALRELATGLVQVLGFQGLGSAELPAAASGKADQTGTALQLARGLVDEHDCCYLEPGEIRQIPGCATVRAFVLGPPTDKAALHRSQPHASPGEVYELAAHRGGAEFFLAALRDNLSAGQAADDDPLRQIERHFPFVKDCGIRIPVHDKMVAPSSAGDADDAAEIQEVRAWFERCYRNPADSWRAIDDDWLAGAGALALKLDSDTNNTSLVLAFELEPGGQVLLFPGDAQVGNWLSWDDVRWQKDKDVTAADLLKRTFLYKVGHHGSHNATLREKGLERMQACGLVAMLPVDVQMARQKRWNRMPLPSLRTRLLEVTQGRLLQADQPPEEWQHESASLAEREHVDRSVRQHFAKFVEWSQETLPGSSLPLYVDLYVT